MPGASTFCNTQLISLLKQLLKSFFKIQSASKLFITKKIIFKFRQIYKTFNFYFAFNPQILLPVADLIGMYDDSLIIDFSIINFELTKLTPAPVSTIKLALRPLILPFNSLAQCILFR